MLAEENSDTSEDELPTNTSSTQGPKHTPAAFLLRPHSTLSPSSYREFHPLLSQIPFLVDVFLENVNLIIHILHVPTINQMVRDLRDKGMAHLTPSNEALMFSIYYAAIASMEEEEVSHFSKKQVIIKANAARNSVNAGLVRSWPILALLNLNSSYGIAWA